MTLREYLNYQYESNVLFGIEKPNIIEFPDSTFEVTSGHSPDSAFNDGYTVKITRYIPWIMNMDNIDLTGVDIIGRHAFTFARMYDSITLKTGTVYKIEKGAFESINKLSLYSVDNLRCIEFGAFKAIENLHIDALDVKPDSEISFLWGKEYI